MSGNTFGDNLKITTFGESHGKAVGVVIDGLPPGIELSEADVQTALDRRRPGQSRYTTSRREPDIPEILSGVFEGRTTGTPVAIIIRNQDQHSSDYDSLRDIFRPGHADYTFFAKFGVRDHRGGGRSSGRETAARVAAGAAAHRILQKHGIEAVAGVVAVGPVKGREFRRDFIESNPLRAADPDALEAMTREIDEAVKARDSVGCVVECRIRGVEPGVGEPVFDKLDAKLAQAMLSIGAVKGFEMGDGFAAAARRGSENNDPMTCGGFASNHSGGVLGGISNGNEIVFRVAVKPTPSIAREQKTLNTRGEEVVCEVKGRHDPCLGPRIVPVIEAMTELVIADLLLAIPPEETPDADSTQSG